MTTATLRLPDTDPQPVPRPGRAAPRVRPPRTSTAVAVVVGAFVAFFPGYLPHGPVLQGATTALCVLAAIWVARLIRRVRPPRSDRAGHFSRSAPTQGPRSDRAAHFSARARRVVLAACGVGLGATLVWTEITQNAMRAAVGWGPAGPTYWAVLLAVATAVVALAAGTRWAWRRRRGLGRAAAAQGRRYWRPVVILLVAGAVLVPATGVQGATASPSPAPQSEQILQRHSPAGAVRVYAGLRDGEDVTARARRAADQLVRAGGLGKSRVVLVVPTGSGWVDENAVRGLERRFHGDVATVGLQYAHVPSWVAYLFGRDGAEQAARALFRAVQQRVARLPADRRPDLHVYGESLGATAGQAIFTGTASAAKARREVCSVLWVGPPGGDTVGLAREDVVANDDDPIVHAGPALLWSPPDDDRPWLPGVSFLQAGVDFIGSLAMPDGSGHRYGPGQVRQLQTCRH